RSARGYCTGRSRRRADGPARPYQVDPLSRYSATAKPAPSARECDLSRSSFAHRRRTGGRDPGPGGRSLMSTETINLETKSERGPWLSHRANVAVARVALVVLIFGAWEFASGRWFSAFWVSKPSLIAAYIWKWVTVGDFF